MRRFLLLLGLALALSGCNNNTLVSTPASPSPEPTPEPTPDAYLGLEFYAVDLDNAGSELAPPGSGVDMAGAQYAVVVSNPDPNTIANITIKSATAEVMTGTVQAGDLTLFELPQADIDGTMMAAKAYHIESDIPVTVHQFNPIENTNITNPEFDNQLGYSSDTSLLLPVTAIGNEYRVLSWPRVVHPLGGYTGAGFLTVVATDENPTTVTVTVTAATEAGGGIPALPSNTSHTVTMNQFDVLNLQVVQGGDLSGSLVVADQNVSVFGGHECANVPIDVIACDHLEEQLFPLETWGRTYVAAKSQFRGSEPDVWRILAREDGTTVSTNPAQPGSPYTLNRGEYITFESPEDFLIEATSPVLVGQYLVGECYGATPILFDPCPNPTAGTGDPALMLLVPVDQFRSDYVFLTPLYYASDSITIVAPTGASLDLDGTAVTGWTPIDSSWQRTVVNVSDGTHKIRGDVGFGVTVTGYDEYVSYGYPGGLNLEALP